MSAAACLAAISTGRVPFRIAPRYWRANMCGVRVPGLQPVPGGANDPSLVLSWFYDRYAAADRAKIRAQWKADGLTHVLVSWPDSQDFGYTPQQFKSMCEELIANGFFPCPMLCAKPDSSANVRTFPETIANIMLVAPLLVGVVPLMCIGWELSLWLTPTEVQTLIDLLTPLFVPSGCRCYVHFQEGYSSDQRADKDFASFWNIQIGKLTGVLHQKKLAQDHQEYRYDSGGIVDVLVRFAGQFNVTPDSGFGHPFDFVALEITATFQFAGSMSQTEGDSWGQWAIDTPAQTGPTGVSVGVMGSGNGALKWPTTGAA